MSIEPNLVLKIKEFNSKESIEDYKNLLRLDWNNNIFYTYEYLIYHENKNQKLKYFLFEKEDKPIILMPFFIRLIPTELNKDNPYFDVITPYGYGGPLFDSKYEDYLSCFWKKVDNWYKENNIITEFVRFSLTNNCKNYSGNLEETLSNIKGQVLCNQETQWENFSPKVRNNYRTAVKSDLSFTHHFGEEITLKDIKDFHTIYTETMIRNNANKSYFFSMEYFENLIFENKNNFEIVFVVKDNLRISTELIIYWKDTLFAFLGGTNKEYFKYRPNDFLRVEVIKLACKKNMNYYVLGGGRKDGDSLFKSKKALFPKDEDCIFYTGRKIINQEIYKQLTANLNTESNPSFFPKYREPIK